MALKFVGYQLTRPFYSRAVTSWSLQIAAVALGVLGARIAIEKGQEINTLFDSGWITWSMLLLPLSIWFVARARRAVAFINRFLTITLTLAWALGRGMLQTGILRGDNLMVFLVKWWFPALFVLLLLRALRRWWKLAEVQTPEESTNPNDPPARILPFTQTWWERHPRIRHLLLQDVQNAPSQLWNYFYKAGMTLSVLVALALVVHFRPENPAEIWKLVPGVGVAAFELWVVFFMLSSAAAWFHPRAQANIPKDEVIVWSARPHWSFFVICLFAYGFFPGEGHFKRWARILFGLGPLVPGVVALFLYYTFKIEIYVYVWFWIVIAFFTLGWLLWGFFGFCHIYYALTGTVETGRWVLAFPQLRLWGVKTHTKSVQRKSVNIADMNPWWGNIGVVDPGTVLSKPGEPERDPVVWYGVPVDKLPAK